MITAAPPPSQNRDCQPWAGIIAALANPDTVAPNGADNMATDTTRPRRDGCTVSASMVSAGGMHPPSPIPATNRRIASCPVVFASAIAMVAGPKIRESPRMIGRRPNLSDKTPPSMAPTAMPR